MNIPLKLESKLVTYYKNLDPLLYLDDASPMSASTDGDTAVAPGDEAHSHSGLFNMKYLPPLPHYISIETKQKLAIPIELPSVALPKAIFERLDRAEHEEKKEMLLDIEMLLVGRSTILLGICMIFNEVTTGVGLLDQLSHIFQLF